MKDPIKFRTNKPIPYGTHYLIQHPRTLARLSIIASMDDGWGHISVSLEKRDPLWDEMCFAKKLFFDKEDLCIQFHPKLSQYVNVHKHCLHIWQPPAHIAATLEMLY